MVGEIPLGTLAFCWRLERRDGAGLALTSLDQPINQDGDTYRSAPGMIPAAVTRQLGLEPHSGEVAGALSNAAITAEDLALGRWDGARVTLTAVDWEDSDAAVVPLLCGELGEVEVKNDGFSAELNGGAARLNAPVCPTTSPECRAELGDKKCRVDLAGRTTVGTIASQDGTELTLDAPVDGKYLLGRLRYLGGENCGLTTKIIAVDGSAVRVRDLPRGRIEAGCRVELREGCDKGLQTCASRFGNAVNFRGEPHLPGTDMLTRYPGA